MGFGPGTANVDILRSEVSDNVTGEFAAGGGIYGFYGDVLVTDSVISGNATSGQSSRGGGIFSSPVTFASPTQPSAVTRRQVQMLGAEAFTATLALMPSPNNPTVAFRVREKTYAT